MSVRKRVLILALDGFTWRLGRKFMSEGVMDALAAVVNGGCHGNLRSVTPCETAPAWSSFQTGCRPGKTGVFAFHTLDRKTGRIRLNSFDDIAVPSIWELADRAERTVVSLNMPLSSPPPKVKGVIIPGLLCPKLSTQTTHPPEAYDKYIKSRKDYLIVNHTVRETVAEFVDQSIASELVRRDVAMEIMKDIDWDIFCFQIQSGDLLQHRMWWALDNSAEGFSENRRQEALEFYRRTDDIIAELVEAAGPETLTIILSDHGFCKAAGAVHVNAWLRKNGYLNLPPEKPQTRWDNVKSAIPPLKFMARLAGASGRISGNLLKNARVTLTGKEKQTPFSEVELQHLRQLIDFDTTQALCLGAMGGMLYMNAQDDRRADFCQTLTEKLLHDLGPQSENPVVSGILPAEEVYGKHENITTTPDLVIEFSEGYCQVINPLGDKIVTPHRPGTKQAGTHDKNGVLILNGPGIKKGLTFDAEIVDIAPTVLAYLGIAVPEHMDGKVLSETFSQPLEVNYEKIDYSGTASTDYTDEEQAEVEKHLSDLGYL